MNPLRAAIVRNARHVHAGGTVARGARPGDGYVFDRLRGYAEGDDPRRIDWSATARIGALQTRVYLEETVLVLGALVDESASMRVGRKRPLSTAADEAVRAWFGAAESTDRAGRIVDERLVGDRRATVDVRAAGPFDLRRSLELAVRVLPQGSSFLLVTDGLDIGAGGAFDDVLLRIGRRFDATVLLARDPWIDGSAAARIRAPARCRERAHATRVHRTAGARTLPARERRARRGHPRALRARALAPRNARRSRRRRARSSARSVCDDLRAPAVSVLAVARGAAFVALAVASAGEREARRSRTRVWLFSKRAIGRAPPWTAIFAALWVLAILTAGAALARPEHRHERSRCTMRRSCCASIRPVRWPRPTSHRRAPKRRAKRR